MSKSAWMSAAVIALLSAAAMLLPDLSPRATAQSAPTYVNAVDLDIVPEHREQFLAAIKENGAATVKEPGCRQFDILVLASNLNHVSSTRSMTTRRLCSRIATPTISKYAATTANMVAKRGAGDVAGGVEFQGATERAFVSLLRVVCASADHPRGSPSCRNNSIRTLPMVGWLAHGFGGTKPMRESSTIPARLELGAFVLLQPRVPMTACAH